MIWWRAFGTGSLEIHALRRAGEVVAVAPFVRRGSALASPTNAESPEFGFLSADDAAAEELTRWLLASASRIAVAKASATDAAIASLVEAAPEAGFDVHRSTQQRSPYLDLSGTWNDFEASISKNFRQTVKRRRRQLEREGTLEIVAYDGTSRLASLLREGFGVEPSEWKAAAGTAIASNPRTELFYSGVAGWATRRGWLRLVFMRLDDKPIAFRLDLQTDDTLFHVKGGFDTAYARFSPGNVLQYWTVEKAFEDRLNRYEFLGADERHKTVWTSTAH